MRDDEEEQTPQEETIFGIEVSRLMHNMYIALFILIGVNLLLSLNPPRPSEQDTKYTQQTERLAELQDILMRSSTTLSDDEYDKVFNELQKLQKEVLINKSNAVSGFVTFSLILAIAGLIHFGACLYLFFMCKDELEEQLTSHAMYILGVEVLFFVLSLFLVPVFMLIPILSFVLVALFNGAQAFLAACGYLLLQKEESITKDTVKTQALTLIAFGKEQIKERTKGLQKK